MATKTLTMAAVVGANVRRLREDQGWSQQDLTDRLAETGTQWSRPTVAQLELGKRGTSVDDLLAVALTLGVAPHVLLYPPAGTEVAITSTAAMPGEDLANWLWDPGSSPLTALSQPSERSVWFASAKVAEALSDEEVEQIRGRIAAESKGQTDKRKILRMGGKVVEVGPDEVTETTGTKVRRRQRTPKETD